ncbi:unnamed protein product [Blepharisma stoltei]|uniref:Uncharacterized protein n=1 Tax=Blepharisma stoltei TaxID=1481888 RepID=A0AAU9K4T2_9CILI|nr:unnamed protein product [Blepharisma stoltei]
MSSIFEHFQSKLKERGITSQNLLRATYIFVGLNVVWIGTLWTFCFIVSPTKNIVSKLPWQFVKNAFAKVEYKANAQKHPKRLPEEKRGRLSISFVEMLVMKGLLGPVALPIKLWLAIKLTNFSQTAPPNSTQ